MAERPCLVCGGSFSVAAIPGLLACNDCGLMTADMVLGPDALKNLYTESYFKGEEYRDYPAERAIAEKNFRHRLGRLLKYVPDAASKRLLEIGCAYGFFLCVAAERFRTVEGIDISQEAVDYARNSIGLNVRAGDFLSVSPLPKYDVVCLWDTIEHLSRPDSYLERIAQTIQTGGIIAITTGDIGSPMARWRGRRWRQIHPPTHLHYFSRRTLSMLLRRYGFHVRYCGSDGMYRSLDTIAYGILAVKHRREGLYRQIKKTRLLGWDIYLDLGDIMYVIAEKGSASPDDLPHDS